MTIPVICSKPKEVHFTGIRFVVTALACMSVFVSYVCRQNIGLAITAMTNLNKTRLQQNQLHSNLHNSTSEFCPVPIDENGLQVLPESYGPKYDWTPAQTNLILGSLYVPYVIFQIPLSRMSEIFGAKWILMLSAAGSGLISVLSPYAASVHPYALALLRALMGICQTALFPTVYLVLTKWLAPGERGRAIPFLGAAGYLGTFATNLATGYVNGSSSFGWPYSFYLGGIICAIWSIAWLALGASEPRQHRLMSLKELEYIESATGTKHNASKKDISWKKIFISRDIWVLVLTFCAGDWVFTFNSSYLPPYLNSVHRVTQLKNGFFNSTFCLLNIAVSPFIGFIATSMIEKRTCGFNSLQVRKLFQSIALLGQAGGFIIIILAGCDTNLIIGILILMNITLAFIRGGEAQIPSELSKDFAGTIYAICNCVGSTSGFLVPLVHNLMISDINNINQWNSFFYLLAILSILGCINFVLFANNNEQDFSKHNNEKIVEEAEHCHSYNVKTEAITQRFKN